MVCERCAVLGHRLDSIINIARPADFLSGSTSRLYIQSIDVVYFASSQLLTSLCCAFSVCLRRKQTRRRRRLMERTKINTLKSVGLVGWALPFSSQSEERPLLLFGTPSRDDRYRTVKPHKHKINDAVGNYRGEKEKRKQKSRQPKIFMSKACSSDKVIKTK